MHHNGIKMKRLSLSFAVSSLFILSSLSIPTIAFLVQQNSRIPSTYRVKNWKLHGIQSSMSDEGQQECSEIVVINWECLVDTRNYRIDLGMKTALQVWPELQELWDLTDDHEWLSNKLLALSHVFSENNDGSSVTCDYALATRLLLEEQELDQGESVGKKGKYASQFHPRASSSTTTSTTGTESGRSSTRPLTVGEISINWNSFIRETLEMKYHVKYQNPLPILQSTVDELQDTSLSQEQEPSSLIAEFPTASLSLTNKKIVFTVPHSSDWKIAQSCLETAALDFQVVESISEALNCHSPISLLLEEKDEKSIPALQKLLKEAPADSTVTMIESSWNRLHQHVDLFGDNIPRQDNRAKCIYADKQLSLFLAEWPGTSHPTHQSSATMNPWTDVLDWERLDSLLPPTKSFE